MTAKASVGSRQNIVSGRSSLSPRPVTCRARRELECCFFTLTAFSAVRKRRSFSQTHPLIKHRISLPPAAHALIDEFMPVCDLSEYHETTVHAPIEKVYAALRTANLRDSRLIRLLLRLRELPAIVTTGAHKRSLKLDLDAIIKGGFVWLGENPPNEIALGLVGRFWTLSGSRCRVNAEEFASFDLPGYAKA